VNYFTPNLGEIGASYVREAAVVAAVDGLRRMDARALGSFRAVAGGRRGAPVVGRALNVVPIPSKLHEGRRLPARLLDRERPGAQ